MFAVYFFYFVSFKGRLHVNQRTNPLVVVSGRIRECKTTIAINVYHSRVATMGMHLHSQKI